MFLFFFFFFFFKQKTAYEIMPSLVGSEMCIRDSGYAVADHRTIRTDLGTMDDLADLTATLRAHGISLVMDLIVNHVAAEHEWARRARAGQQKYLSLIHI